MENAQGCKYNGTSVKSRSGFLGLAFIFYFHIKIYLPTLSSTYSSKKFKATLFMYIHSVYKLELYFVLYQGCRIKGWKVPFFKELGAPSLNYISVKSIIKGKKLAANLSAEYIVLLHPSYVPVSVWTLYRYAQQVQAAYR